MLLNYTGMCTFATTVPILLPVRTASGSSFLGHIITYNTPPLPLSMAHLGGIFFFGKPLVINSKSN